jgi:hypothetical protein
MSFDNWLLASPQSGSANVNPKGMPYEKNIVEDYIETTCYMPNISPFALCRIRFELLS